MVYGGADRAGLCVQLGEPRRAWVEAMPQAAGGVHQLAMSGSWGRSRADTPRRWLPTTDDQHR